MGGKMPLFTRHIPKISKLKLFLAVLVIAIVLSLWTVLPRRSPPISQHDQLSPLTDDVVCPAELAHRIDTLLAVSVSLAKQSQPPDHANGNLQVVWPIAFLINQPDICRNGHIFLLIYVHSSPNHFDHRNAVRDSWGNQTFLSLFASRIVFILGQSGEGLKLLRIIQRYFSSPCLNSIFHNFSFEKYIP